MGFGLRLQADRVADDHAVAFEPRHAVLHRAARHLELLRQRRHGGARVVAQQCDQLTVGIVDIGHIASTLWQCVQHSQHFDQFTAFLLAAALERLLPRVPGTSTQETLNMTRFIDVPALSQLVQELGVSRFIEELADTIREDFLRWEDFDKSARVASHSQLGVIELMPVADTQRYAFKYVNGHPSNTARGMYTVMAFGVLADVATGYPQLLSELTLTTALRTAATSAMAARALARPNSRRMALIGNGAQSEFQALAFHHLLGIDELRVFDVDGAATDKLARNLAAYPTLRVVRAASTADAVRGADIVTTVTADKTRATILTPEMIEPGMHINAVGGDCPGKTELHPEVLRRARVF